MKRKIFQSISRCTKNKSSMLLKPRPLRRLWIFLEGTRMTGPSNHGLLIDGQLHFIFFWEVDSMRILEPKLHTGGVDILGHDF